jgi:hypothetical protein
MRTRIVIFLWMSAGIVGAVYAKELAAAYVAIGTAAVVWLAHVIDFKLNKLLDHYGISVSDREIAKD